MTIALQKVILPDNFDSLNLKMTFSDNFNNFNDNFCHFTILTVNTKITHF